ncbi:MAG: hypothetical protein MUP81_05420 [Dehalococcoidia bacterium]|nr:hypothetical protein [Dehalococcoidia bacterium]
MKELDDVIDLLEAEIPANPAAPKNRKLADELEGELKKYFGQVQDMMPMDRLEGIYNKNVEAE